MNLKIFSHCIGWNTRETRREIGNWREPEWNEKLNYRLIKLKAKSVRNTLSSMKTIVGSKTDTEKHSTPSDSNYETNVRGKRLAKDEHNSFSKVLRFSWLLFLCLGQDTQFRMHFCNLKRKESFWIRKRKRKEKEREDKETETE